MSKPSNPSKGLGGNIGCIDKNSTCCCSSTIIDDGTYVVYLPPSPSLPPFFFFFLGIFLDRNGADALKKREAMISGVLRIINGTTRQHHAAMLEAEARRATAAAGTKATDYIYVETGVTQLEGSR